MSDPLKHGSGAAPQAAAAGPVVPAESVALVPGAGSFGAPMKARPRRYVRPRSRQALAPLRTAMWAAYPRIPAVAA